MVDPRRFSRGMATILVAAALLVACGDDDDPAAPDSTALAPATVSTTAPDGSTGDPGAPSPDDGDRTAPLSSISLDIVAVATVSSPTAVRVHPTDGRLYVTTKDGTVIDLVSGDVALDLRGRITDNGERGLLGLAFSSDGTAAYVSYTNQDGDSRVAAHAFADGAADTDGVEIIGIDQPFANHNGGDIHLGPDGHLWIALGDGGSRGDPEDNGEDPNDLLGSILRIEPTPGDAKPYAIPADNPFAAGGGAPEVWLYGVRNPWRIHFDPETDDLWVADVGQNAWEEVTVLPAADGRGRGAHLGWDHFEGTHVFEGGAPEGTVPPVYEYSHDDGCSITGGVVYRGDALPALDGAYLFADFCRSDLRAIRVVDGVTVDLGTWDLGLEGVQSFGVDADGEVLILQADGRISRLVPG